MDLEFRAPIAMGTKSVVPLRLLKDFKIRDAGINYQRVKVGMQEKGKSDLAERLLYEGKQERDDDKMYWKGTDIDRYWMASSTSRWCRPDVKLRPNEVMRLNDRVYKTVPKVLLRQTADRPIAVVDNRGIWFGRSVIAVTKEGTTPYAIEYLAALLNSKYMTYVYQAITSEQGRVFAQVKLAKLNQLPIRAIKFDQKLDNECHGRLVDLVRQMQKYIAEVAKVKTAHQRTAFERRIEATDREIDGIVYELYGLMDEEIALVEGATK